MSKVTGSQEVIIPPVLAIVGDSDIIDLKIKELQKSKPVTLFFAGILPEDGRKQG